MRSLGTLHRLNVSVPSATRRRASSCNNSQDTVIAFVNKKSGGLQGANVLTILKQLLGNDNVFELRGDDPAKRPEAILRQRLHQNVHFRIIAAGGDGTAAWMFYALDQLNALKTNSVAVLPLGTGNDMAGYLKWGYGGEANDNEKYLKDFVEAVRGAQIVKIDRWNLKVFQNPGFVKSLPYEVFNNYLSIGVDANIALKFHKQRSGLSGRFHFLFFSSQVGERRSLDEFVSLECDGKCMDERLKYLKPDTILFLNVKSYAGGCKPWGCQHEFSRVPYFEKWLKQRSDDRILEVIAYTLTEFGDLVLGGRGHRLAQCREARLETRQPIPMKVDGEPVMMEPCVINIDWRNAGLGLRNVSNGKYYDAVELDHECNDDANFDTRSV